MAILKFEGSVSTNRVGSACKFEFEIDEKDLPTDPEARRNALEEMALEAMWDSGQVNWSYEQKP